MELFLFCMFALSYVEGKPTTIFAPKEEYNPDLWQGDIELAPGQTPEGFSAIVDKSLRWTDKTLYYTIGSEYSSDQIAQIEAGANDIQTSTGCVSLVRIPDGETPPENYVYIEKFSGCSSYVGMIGGGQRISLVDGCFVHGTIMHEFLHAFGIYHEHQRGDRDEYVTINWDNIEPGLEYAFEKYEEGTEIDHLGTGYDYGSCMHYSRTAFAVDPSVDTITPKDPDAEIGQRERLSELDIARLQILYECVKVEDSIFKGMTMEEIFGSAKKS